MPCGLRCRFRRCLAAICFYIVGCLLPVFRLMLFLIKRLVLSLLLILVVFYAGLLWLAWRADRIIFQPPPSSYLDKAPFAPYQFFNIISGANGPHTRVGTASITTLYIPNPHARFTLLMSHGNAEDIGQNRDLYEEYRRRGFAVFAYDYRGYGTSTGTPTEEGTYADEYAAWDYLVNTLRVPPSRISTSTQLPSGAAPQSNWEKTLYRRSRSASRSAHPRCSIPIRLHRAHQISSVRGTSSPTRAES